MTQHPAVIQEIAQGPALVVSLCGARWNGIQQSHPKDPAKALAVFTDPVTKSTLAMPLAQVTVGTVYRALQAKRALYAAAMNGERA